MDHQELCGSGHELTVLAADSQAMLTRLFGNALEKKMHLHEAPFRNILVYTETLEITEKTVVPLPGLVWCCEFISRRRKKNMKTWSTPCLQKSWLAHNISTT